jgi:hypothetical protein
MSWAKKINTKIYAIGTAANAGIAIIFGWPDTQMILWLVVVLMGAVVNHYSSVYVVSTLIDSQLSRLAAPISKGKMAFFLIMKILSLILAFALLVNYARSKVPHGIIIYIFQLIILTLSIKNIEHLIKKGPLE